MSIPTHCCQCGTPYHPTELWPKKCGQCHHEVWGNPIPVSIALCGTRDRILLVQRNIPPGRGLWALPGGYLNRWETPEAGASRETQEETERTEERDGQLHTAHYGLMLPSDVFMHFMTTGRPELNLTLMFYQAGGIEDQLTEWWKRTRAHRDAGGIWNTEVQSLALVTSREAADLPIAFPTHRQAIQRWFRDQSR